MDTGIINPLFEPILEKGKHLYYVDDSGIIIINKLMLCENFSVDPKELLVIVFLKDEVMSELTIITSSSAQLHAGGFAP